MPSPKKSSPKKSSSKKSSPKKSSSKISQEQQEFKKLMSKIDTATRVIGAAGVGVGAKMLYDNFKGNPKKYLTPEEYLKFQEVSAKVSKLFKVKLATFENGSGNITNTCTDEDCKEYVKLLNLAAQRKATNTPARNWYDPRGLFGI